MKFSLDPSSELPNYLQLEQQIKTACLNGKLKPGDQLPSIRALAKELSIAIITVKRAYDDLEKEKIIELRQGKGAFVHHIETQQLQHEAYHQMQQKLEVLISLAKSLGLSNKEIITLLNHQIYKIKEDETYE